MVGNTMQCTVKHQDTKSERLWCSSEDGAKYQVGGWDGILRWVRVKVQKTWMLTSATQHFCQKRTQHFWVLQSSRVITPFNYLRALVDSLQHRNQKWSWRQKRHVRKWKLQSWNLIQTSTHQKYYCWQIYWILTKFGWWFSVACWQQVLETYWLLTNKCCELHRSQS